MKINLVGADLFHADGRTDRRTDMTKVILSFRNFPTRLRNTEADWQLILWY